MSTSAVAVPAHRWWIDALLVGTGATAAAFGWYLAGGIVVAVGLSFPLLHAIGVRGRSSAHALRYAPPDLADRVQRIHAVAARVPDVETRRAVERADDFLLEAAAIFAGRPVRGATHRRYVRQRSALLDGILTDLTERADALTAARAEVDALDVHHVDRVESQPSASDPLATALLWLLTPLFIVWELGATLWSGTLRFVEGIVLRLRTLATLLLRGVVAVGRLVLASLRRWRDLRIRFAASWREARRQFVAARLRLRLRLRRAGRAA